MASSAWGSDGPAMTSVGVPSRGGLGDFLNIFLKTRLMVFGEKSGGPTTPNTTLLLSETSFRLSIGVARSSNQTYGVPVRLGGHRPQVVRGWAIPWHQQQESRCGGSGFERDRHHPTDMHAMYPSWNITYSHVFPVT